MKLHAKKTMYLSLLLTSVLLTDTLPLTFDSSAYEVASAQGTASSEKLRKTMLPESNAIEAEPVIEVPASPLPQADPPPGVTLPKADSIIVKYKTGTGPAANASASGLTLERTLPTLKAEVLRVPEGMDIETLLAQFKSDPNVLYAEPDGHVVTSEPGASGAVASHRSPAPEVPTSQSAAPMNEPAADSAALQPLIPNDPYFPAQWGLNNTFDSNEPPIFSKSDIDINAPEAWPLLQDKGKEVVVAVISDGVDFDHPDLANRIWTNDKEIPNNGIDDDGNGYVDDVHGWDFNHDDNDADDLNDPATRGTAISGNVAANMNNAIGIAGIAPNAKILPIKTFSSISRSGTFSQILAGIAYAEQMGADVAVLDFTSWAPSESILDALQHSDMLFVAQPGDYFSDLDQAPSYPASYKLPNVLTVSGIQADGRVLTAYGKKTVQIAAPAMNTLTTLPSENPAYAAQIDTGSYRAIYNGLGFENLPSPIQTDTFHKALDFLGEGIDKPSVLLVQDDNSVGGNEEEHSFLELYKSFLLSAGYETDGIPLDDARGTFNVVSVPKNENGPALEAMQDYDVVVWFTGYANANSFPDSNAPSVLTDSDKANVTSYLQAGGRLLLTGRDALFGSETSPFLTDVLHLDYLYDISHISYSDNYNLIGNDGTIYAGQFAPLSYVDRSGFIAPRDSFARGNLLIDMPDYNYHDSYGAPAVAYAAGTAALVLGQNPGYDAKTTIQRLINSGKKVSYLAGATMSGKMLDAYRAISDKDIPGTPLEVSEVSEHLDEASDPDRVYAVELNAGETIQAELTGEAGTDFDLYLYSPSAVTVHGKIGIVAASEHPGTSSEGFSYLVKQTGTYYLNVYAFAGTGSYALRLQHTNANGTYEEDADELTFAGDWETVSGEALSRGRAKRIDAPGHVEFTFEGSYIEWIGAKNPQQGIADVYIDGKLASSVSLYDKSESTRQTLFKKAIAFDKHTIRVAWTGKTDPRARKGDPAFVNVDAFVVKHLVQDADSSQLRYEGTWATSFSTVYSGHSVTTSIQKDDFAELTFTGTSVRFLAPVGDNRGIAAIYIDGQLTKTVDFYRTVRQQGTVVFESDALAEGTHTVRVVNGGTKNPASSGYAVSIDAFEIN